MDRTRAYGYVHYFKMVDRRGLTFLTMFSTAKCKVTAANNTLPVFKDGFTYAPINVNPVPRPYGDRVGDIRGFEII